MGGNQAMDFFLPTRAYTNNRGEGNKIGRFLLPISTLTHNHKNVAKVESSAPIMSTPADEAQRLREEKLTALRRKGVSSTILSKAGSGESAMRGETLGSKTLVS